MKTLSEIWNEVKRPFKAKKVRATEGSALTPFPVGQEVQVMEKLEERPAVRAVVTKSEMEKVHTIRDNPVWIRIED